MLHIHIGPTLKLILQDKLLIQTLELLKKYVDFINFQTLVIACDIKCKQTFLLHMVGLI